MNLPLLTFDCGDQQLLHSWCKALESPALPRCRLRNGAVRQIVLLDRSSLMIGLQLGTWNCTDWAVVEYSTAGIQVQYASLSGTVPQMASVKAWSLTC